MKAVANKCGLVLTHVDHRRVQYCERTEKLIQAEISDFCDRWDCIRCTKTHKEWFKKDSQFLKECLHKWADFMDRAPYDSKELQPFWKNWLEMRTHHSSREDLTYKKLRLLWTKSLVPTPLGRCHFEYEKITAYLGLYFWQVNA